MIWRWSMPFSALAAVARVAWARIFGYEILVPNEEQFTREWTCLGCEFYNEDQCSVCGCLIIAKTALALEQCPKKKWLRVWRKKVIACKRPK